MGLQIDTTFNVCSDTPPGKDPDCHSPTLRRYHQALWSKPLPDGTIFELSTDIPGAYLHHRSELGEFVLSSDAFGHTYRHVKAMAPIVNQVPLEELDQFHAACSTIGGYIVFPARRVDGKITINGARGFNSKIRDRFDLTLECIRRHYHDLESPLGDVLGRYANFFGLFRNFSGYVEFFLLQDFVSSDRKSVDFLLPFPGFDASPLPKSVNEYRAYKHNLIAAGSARNRRIAAQPY